MKSPNNSELVAHLVRFCLDSLRVFGERRGRAYIENCVPIWRQHYGDVVVARIRAELEGGARE